MRPRCRLAGGGLGAVFTARLGGGAGAVFTARLGGLADAKWARRLPGGVSRGGGHTFIFACSEPVVHLIDRAGESNAARATSGRTLVGALKAACGHLGEGSCVDPGEGVLRQPRRGCPPTSVVVMTSGTKGL